MRTNRHSTRPRRFSLALPIVSASMWAAWSGPAAAQPSSAASVDGRLELAFESRPRADRYGARLAPSGRVPVVIRFAVEPTSAFLGSIESTGTRISRRARGEPAGRGRAIAATVTRAALARLRAHPGVDRIELDGQLFPAPRPLDYTSSLIATKEVWEASSPWLPRGAAPPGLEPPARNQAAITGAGVTVCDIDSGIDPFHPMMFRADGGYYDWIDVNGDGWFHPGIDAVDLGGAAPVVLQTLNLPITQFWSPEPQMESSEPDFELGLDYLFADANASGQRDFGASAGFTEDDPTFGERLFVADDVDGNGRLDRGEKVVALGTSKIRSFRIDGTVYRRGENLIETPRENDFAHGMGAAAIMAGGQPGFSRLVGIAPGAEIVMASSKEGGNEFFMTDFCIDEGARVVLHEYAPWTGYHLDGSSLMEQLIDDTAEDGISHINPAGNLSTSQKLFKRTLPAGAITDVPIAVLEDSPYAPFRLVGLTVLWQDTGRDLELTLTDPVGHTAVITGHDGVFQTPFGEHFLYSFREDSDRGTVKVDAYVFGESAFSPPLEHGTWTMTVSDPEAAGGEDLELIAYVLDDVSGWGKGVHFPEHSSEDHLIGYPGTADLGLAVAAYVGHGFGDGELSGARASYSGRGRRIDDTQILSISAPDDPITAGIWTDHPASYVMYGGTSGASPHVAGTAALLLSAEPGLDGVEMRDRIRASAAVDNLVGDVPNEDFGYGKLRAYEAVFGQAPAGGSPPTIEIESVLAGEDEPALFHVEVGDADEPAENLAIDVDENYDGVYELRLSGDTFEVNAIGPGTRIANVRVVDSTGKTARALGVVTFTAAGEPPPDSPLVGLEPGAGDAEQGGCGCRIVPAPSSGKRGGSAPWLLLLAALGAAIRQATK